VIFVSKQVNNFSAISWRMEKMCYLFDEMMSVFVLNQHAEFDFSRNLELYFYFHSYIEGLYFVRQ